MQKREARLKRGSFRLEKDKELEKSSKTQCPINGYAKNMRVRNTEFMYRCEPNERVRETNIMPIQATIAKTYNAIHAYYVWRRRRNLEKC